MAALTLDLNTVRVAVQKTVEKEGSWDSIDWNDVEDVVSILLNVGENRSKVLAAAVGLVVDGATTQETLQGVADNKEEFKWQLTADKYGVPAAICNLLFARTWPEKATGGGRAAAASWTIGRSSTRSRRRAG